MHFANLHKDVTTVEQDRYLLVRIDTSITLSNAEQIRKDVVAAWEEHPDAEALILELDGVTQMDSSGVGVLMELASRAEKAGLPLRICGLQKGPRSLLQRTRLDKMFYICTTVEEASRDIPHKERVVLPAARKRDRTGDRERPRHSHRLLWTTMVLLLIMLIAAGAYGYMALGAYRGKMNLFPAMQANLVAAGQRIDATENSMRNWVAERDQWGKHVEAKIDGALRNARQQANEVTHGRQILQAEIDQRTSNLQTQVNNIQAAQKATDDRVANVEEQVRELENTRADEPSAEKPAANSVIGRERKDFVLPLHGEQEVAPGVWIGFTNTDVANQRYDGNMRLMADRRAIAIHRRGIAQPLEFSLRGDDKRAQLVVTRVTSNSVTGYVLLPRPAESL